MSAVDGVREAREMVGDRVNRLDEATFAFIIGVGAFCLFWAISTDTDGRVTFAAVMAGLAYMVGRQYAAESDPTADPRRRSVAGEVRQVLSADELVDHHAATDALKRRVAATGEAVVVVETVAPESTVARWLVRRFPVSLLESFVDWFTGGRVRAYDTEVVLLEDPPAEGDHVALAAREATVEIVLDAHEPTRPTSITVEDGGSA